MPLDLMTPAGLTAALVPDLVIAVGAMILLLFAAWRPATAEHQRHVGLGGVLVILLTIAAVVWTWTRGLVAGVGPVAVDGFRWAADVVLLLGALLTILVAVEYQQREEIVAPESHVLVLLATSGMMLLVAARDLTVIFLGIELMSIAVYALVAINRRSARSAEGSLKYFLLGSFATGFLLYGMALVYGVSGSTNFAGIAAALDVPGALDSPLLKVGLALLVVGFGFKVAAAPFHMWATGFMAATVKAAAIAAFLRLFVECFPAAVEQWHFALWWLAAITMVVGNLTALVQRNLKRMLAYSSIAHAGYLLVAIVVGVGQGPSTGITGSGALLFYIFAYTLATMGAFAILAALARPGDHGQEIGDYSGLWTVRPGLTLAMSVFMLALLGFPVFGGSGFWAKWYLIQAALRGGASPQTRLVVILVITSVLSAGYYLYVVSVLFWGPPPEGAPTPPALGRLTSVAVAATVLLILYVGFAPSQVLRVMNDSALQPSAVAAPPPGAVAQTP
jgi:NADH-quinone oxidoreductase subunit N